MANGTKTFEIDGITYTAHELGEGRWSVRVEDPETCEAINEGPLNLADDDQISAALGVQVRFLDGGDHPSAIETIYQVV